MISDATRVAIIPCLNEERSIGSVVEGARRHLGNVIVVDDGSMDRTAFIAEQMGASVVRHDVSRGKGAAIRTGLQRACGSGAQWALLLDGDGQHSPADIPAFFATAEKFHASLVVGNRMEQRSAMPWLRWRVNHWMSRRLSRLTGQNLPDSQCGFRLLNLKAMPALQLQTNHFQIESEILLSFAAKGETIAFVPIEVIYQGENSKISPIRDSIRWFRWWKSARRFMADHQKVNPARTP